MYYKSNCRIPLHELSKSVPDSFSNNNLLMAYKSGMDAILCHLAPVINTWLNKPDKEGVWVLFFPAWGSYEMARLTRSDNRDSTLKSLARVVLEEDCFVLNDAFHTRSNSALVSECKWLFIGD